MNNCYKNINESNMGLLIKSDGRLIPLSQWGSFFMDLGYYLNQLKPYKDHKTIIALAIPTRLFAVALTALGYVSSRIIDSCENDCIKYVDFLKTLETNTPVRIRLASNRSMKGHYSGYKQRGGILYFDIRDVKSGTISIKASESRKIEVIDKNVKLTKTQTGRELKPATPFAVDFLGEEYISRLITESTLDLVFIGSRERIRREVADQTFYSTHDNQGTLQEIIRTAEFQSSIESHRSRVLSGRNNTKKIHTNIPDPPFVFFDGAQGFLKWRSYWKGSNWAVFLERTETQFLPAVEQINQYYSQRKNTVDLTPLQQVIPSCIEAIGFQV